jgi:phage terminase Nu1 subunit (DNA packaging protein)
MGTKTHTRPTYHRYRWKNRISSRISIQNAHHEMENHLSVRATTELTHLRRILYTLKNPAAMTKVMAATVVKHHRQRLVMSLSSLLLLLRMLQRTQQ